jgi:hypothetical protein
MIQLTEQRGQAWAEAAERVAAKVRAFEDGLAADERLILGRAVWLAVAAGRDAEVAGYADNPALREGLKRLGESAIGGTLGNALWAGLKALGEWIATPSTTPWPGPPSH